MSTGRHRVGAFVPVSPGGATAGGTGPKIRLTMRPAWVVRGYVLARRRVETHAAEEGRNACEISICLFELGNWLVTLYEHFNLKGNADARAVRFLRNRVQHHWAAAVYYDSARSEWCWYGAANVPEPKRSKYRAGPEGDEEYKRHLDRRGERMYRQQLEQKPVRDVFRRLEPRVVALAPDADLS